MVVNLTYELQKDDLITWIPLKDIYFSKFNYSQNFGKLGLCGCPGTLLDSNNQKIGIGNHGARFDGNGFPTSNAV